MFCGWLGSLLLAGAARSGDFPDEPWSVTPAAPVLASIPAAAAQRAADSAGESVSRTVCFGWLAFYQQVLHVVTISHCPMHPSCSNYSLAAVHKHGAFLGVILTADRLLHENDEQYYAPIIPRNGRSLYADPVERNDFWWGTR
jgi:hypothetical protein